MISINEEIIQQTIELRKTSKIKIPDAIIGATTLVYDLTLVTRNIHDFRNIKGLMLTNNKVAYWSRTQRAICPHPHFPLICGLVIPPKTTCPTARTKH